jgi:hypothetical protein
MAPALHDERIELRAPSAEVERWRKAAAREQLALSEWIRNSARAAAAPSPARTVLNALRDQAEQYMRRNPERPGCLLVPKEDELLLLRASRAEVGETLATRIVTEGPRKAFATMFGMTVQWDAPHRGSTPNPMRDAPIKEPAQ